MDVHAELTARQQRPAHPTMAATAGATPPQLPPQPSTFSSPKMKFPLAPAGTAAFVDSSVATVVAVPASTRSSQETLSSPSSPHRVNTTTSTGSSPTKTSSSSSSYEQSTTFQQFHPSNKPTAPLYRPAALRSADHPSPLQPFPNRNSLSFKEVPSVKRDHWKVFPSLN